MWCNSEFTYFFHISPYLNVDDTINCDLRDRSPKTIFALNLIFCKVMRVPKTSWPDLIVPLIFQDRTVEFFLGSTSGQLNGVWIHLKSATLYHLKSSSWLQLALIWDRLKTFNPFWQLEPRGTIYKNTPGRMQLLPNAANGVYFWNISISRVMYSLDSMTRAIDNRRRRVWAASQGGREGASQRCDLERRTDT